MAKNKYVDTKVQNVGTFQVPINGEGSATPKSYTWGQLVAKIPLVASSKDGQTFNRAIRAIKFTSVTVGPAAALVGSSSGVNGAIVQPPEVTFGNADSGLSFVGKDSIHLMKCGPSERNVETSGWKRINITLGTNTQKTVTSIAVLDESGVDVTDRQAVSIKGEIKTFCFAVRMADQSI